MKTLRIPKVQTILHWGILIMCFKAAFSLSAIIPYTESVDTFLVVLSTCCFGAAILQEQYSVKTLIVYSVIGILSLFSVYQTGNYGFMITIIVCLAMRGKELDNILRFIFRYQLYFFIIHTIIALMLALIGKVSIVMNIDGVERYSFGFGHLMLFRYIFLTF